MFLFNMVYFSLLTNEYIFIYLFLNQYLYFIISLLGIIFIRLDGILNEKEKL